MLQAELRPPRGRLGDAASDPPGRGPSSERFHAYLPLATYPVRTGVHSSTSFAIALALEYAEETADDALTALLIETAGRWHAADADCQAWEPSGEDFLSPALIEAEAMRRVLAEAFPAWFDRFLPRAANRQPATLLHPRPPSPTAPTARSPTSTASTSAVPGAGKTSRPHFRTAIRSSRWPGKRPKPTWPSACRTSPATTWANTGWPASPCWRCGTFELTPTFV